MWHLQVTSLTARMYVEPLNYKNQDPYTAIAQIELFGSGIAYIHSMLRTDGMSLSRQDFSELARLAHTDYNVNIVQSIRRGKPHNINIFGLIKER